VPFNFYFSDTGAGLSSGLESFSFHKTQGNPQLSERMLAALLSSTMLHRSRNAAVAVLHAARRNPEGTFWGTCTLFSCYIVYYSFYLEPHYT
jgi:hypothetical protein